MKTFENIAAQGDVMFKRVESLPEGFKLTKGENGVHVVAHSETGHNHVIKESEAKLYSNDNDPFVAYLIVDNTAKLEHMRSFDTHETVMFKEGIYKITRQREYTAEGYRRAQD